jgi:hypothetical protein
MQGDSFHLVDEAVFRAIKAELLVGTMPYAIETAYFNFFAELRSPRGGSFAVRPDLRSRRAARSALQNGWRRNSFGPSSRFAAADLV